MNNLIIIHFSRVRVLVFSFIHRLLLFYIDGKRTGLYCNSTQPSTAYYYKNSLIITLQFQNTQNILDGKTALIMH